MNAAYLHEIKSNFSLMRLSRHHKVDLASLTTDEAKKVIEAVKKEVSTRINQHDLETCTSSNFDDALLKVAQCFPVRAFRTPQNQTLYVMGEHHSFLLNNSKKLKGEAPENYRDFLNFFQLRLVEGEVNPDTIDRLVLHLQRNYESPIDMTTREFISKSNSSLFANTVESAPPGTRWFKPQTVAGIAFLGTSGISSIFSSFSIQLSMGVSLAVMAASICHVLMQSTPAKLDKMRPRRDIFMAHQISNLLFDYSNVSRAIAIVGKNHVQGICENLAVLGWEEITNPFTSIPHTA